MAIMCMVERVLSSSSSGIVDYNAPLNCYTFRVKVGGKVKIKRKTVFETINFIYPENLGL